ncbi:MAG: FtsX-like permease family protein [Planctomycetes bacterium]|nr:FtsX-like permease family protein [Planctomycetota bacterium]
MVGNVLHRKLARDLRGGWGQFTAAAAVVLWATVLFVSFQVTYRSLLHSRDSYYRRCNFADFFVDLENAPSSALSAAQSIKGVWRVRGRIVKEVSLEMEGEEGAAVGRIISMPRRRDDLINDIYMVSGSYFPGAASEEVIINQRFAEANGLAVGDSLRATINERKEDLRIVGTAYSPEYVYPLRDARQFAPDDKGFAIIFARRGFVEDAFDMTNDFNNLVGVLRPGADVEAVLDRAKERFSRYGVYARYGRARQLSHNYLEQELQGVKVSARIVPAIFLTVAAVVIHIIMRRMVQMQRTQIGLLRALGYGRLRIALHYISYALVVGVAAAALGVVGGLYLARGILAMYHPFFRFPSLRVQSAPSALLLAFGLSCGMCVLGALRSAWKAMRLDPAVALRPRAPRLERIVHRDALAPLWEKVPLTWRMNARNALRNKTRAAFTVFGVAISMMMLVVGRNNMNLFNWIVKHQYEDVELADFRVDFADQRPTHSILDVEAVAGVRRAEGVLQVGAELRNGWRKKEALIMGLPAGSELYRVCDAEGNRVPLPPDGLIVPARIADALGIRRGQQITLDPYLRGKDERPAVVRGVVKQYIGLVVYADRRYLSRLLGEGDMVNSALVDSDAVPTQQAMDRLDDMPGVMAVTSARRMLQNLMEEMADLMNVATLIQIFAAAIIAFAVIYNVTSVNIAEQERDLAGLRSLGYGRGQVADIATNDIMPLGIAGICLGMPIAHMACQAMAKAYETDIYRLPVIVSATSYGESAVVVMLFLLIARWICRRRAERIKIAQRLKTRE